MCLILYMGLHMGAKIGCMITRMTTEVSKLSMDLEV